MGSEESESIRGVRSVQISSTRGFQEGEQSREAPFPSEVERPRKGWPQRSQPAPPSSDAVPDTIAQPVMSCHTSAIRVLGPPR